MISRNKPGDSFHMLLYWRAGLIMAKQVPDTPEPQRNRSPSSLQGDVPTANRQEYILVGMRVICTRQE